jgi:hypothetical protein
LAIGAGSGGAGAGKVLSGRPGGDGAGAIPRFEGAAGGWGGASFGLQATSARIRGESAKRLMGASFLSLGDAERLIIWNRMCWAREGRAILGSGSATDG